MLVYQSRGSVLAGLAAGLMLTGFVMTAIARDTERVQERIVISNCEYYAVRIGGRYGFIDNRGKIVIQPSFARAYQHSSEGRLVVGDGNRLGYIDCQGELVIPFQFDAVRNFSDGLAAVQMGSRWGYIDRSGQFVIAPKFAIAFDFSAGVAKVGKETRSSRLFSWTADAGKTLNYYFIDRSGNRIDPEAPERSSAKPALSLIHMNGRFGYANADGEPVIEAKFEEAQEFSNGMAAVKVDGRWGYIDAAGVVVVKPAYDFAYPFHGELGAVSVKGATGYVNREGTMIWSPS